MNGRDARSDSAGTTTAARARDSASVSQSGASTANDDTPPTQLARRWQDHTSDELRALIGNVQFVQNGQYTTDHRKCVGDGQAGSMDCNLRITPVAGTRKLPESSPYPNGVLLASIENIGDKTESMLKIPRKEMAYWIVQQDGASNVGIVVSLSGTKPRELSRGRFRVCTADATHPKPPHGATSASFRCCGSCPQPVAPPRAPSDTSFTEHTSPPWITCALGCCYAEY